MLQFRNAEEEAGQEEEGGWKRRTGGQQLCSLRTPLSPRTTIFTSTTIRRLAGRAATTACLSRHGSLTIPPYTDTPTTAPRITAERVPVLPAGSYYRPPAAPSIRICTAVSYHAQRHYAAAGLLNAHLPARMRVCHRNNHGATPVATSNTYLWARSQTWLFNWFCAWYLPLLASYRWRGRPAGYHSALQRRR